MRKEKRERTSLRKRDWPFCRCYLLIFFIVNDVAKIEHTVEDSSLDYLLKGDHKVKICILTLPVFQ